MAVWLFDLQRKGLEFPASSASWSSPSGSQKEAVDESKPIHSASLLWASKLDCLKGFFNFCQNGPESKDNSPFSGHYRRRFWQNGVHATRESSGGSGDRRNSHQNHGVRGKTPQIWEHFDWNKRLLPDNQENWAENSRKVIFQHQRRHSLWIRPVFPWEWRGLLEWPVPNQGTRW